MIKALKSLSSSILAKTVNTSAKPALVICDMSNAPFVDLAGAEMLSGLQRELASKGIEFRIVEARSNVRDFLRVEGMEEKVGKIGRRYSVADLLEEHHSRAGTGVADAGAA